jgi:AcrR family transcriptional regulator
MPTAAPRPTPTGSRTDVRRNQILAAVLACLGEGGFDAVSMRAVAHGAGVPLGSLHYYFRNKEEMVGAALARTVDDTIAGIIAGVDETAAPRTRLRTLVVDAVPRLCADPALVPVYIGFWSWCQKVPGRRALYHRVSESVHTRLRLLIEEGVRRGDFHPGDPGIAATMVLSTLVGFLLDHHGGDECTPQLVEGLHGRLEAALGV